MPDPELLDTVIVGGGPGGLTAGLYCMRAALKTVLFEKAIAGGQIAISKEVENYPGQDGITGFDLAEKMLRQAKSFGLQIIQKEVVAVEPGDTIHSIRLADGGKLDAYAVILATGGNTRKLNIRGEEEYAGRGVSYCATCDGYFFKDRIVVVVGGGDTAAEEALYLSKLVKKVFLVHRRDTLRASRIIQQRLISDSKIEVIWNTIAKEIRGDGTGVESVVLEDVTDGKTRELATDGVFIFVGYSPNNNLVPGPVRMNDKGYVITDEKCETSVPGIFAIGDMRQKYANQIVIAAADGAIAALAASHYVESIKFQSLQAR